MNTKEIQQKFPQVFQELFSKCSIVASAPGDFFWAGEHGILYGGLGIVQHIPLRSYVGFKSNADNCIRLVEIKTYGPSRLEFENINFDIYDFSQMNELLTAEKNKITSKDVGFDIYGISELPISCGLNASGAFSAALATVFFVSLGELTPNEVCGWQKVAPSKLCLDSKFNKVFRLAWKINSILHGKVYSTIRTFAPLACGSLPIFSGRDSIHSQTNIAEEVDHVAYWAGGLSEIVTDQKIINWPIDIAIIYSGEKRPTGFLANTTEETRVSLETVSQEIQRQIKNLSSITHNTPFLCNISMKNALWFNYLNAMSTISLEIFYALHRVFGSTGDEVLSNLLRALRKHNHGLRLMNLTSSWTQQVILAMKEYSRTHGRMMAGIKLIGGGQSGDILFVTPFNDMRDKVDDLVEWLKQKDLTKPVHLDYTSWRDGLEPVGVKIEQDLHNKIYSSWVSADTYRIAHLNLKGELHQSLVSKKECEQIKVNAPILLDKIEKRIYIGGKKLTSKELKSTSATMEIIESLLNKPGRKIRNNELPRSTYATNRNEFQSKIMIPLNKTLKDLSKNPLFELHGGITEFAIGLKPGKEIHVLEKVS
ncbi:MAG: hypothetical protein V1807_01495 [Patescibacteria group bacterium]